MADCYSCRFNIKAAKGYACSLGKDRSKPYCSSRKSVYSKDKSVLAIILLAAIGWAALVTFVLATNLLTGAAWSLAGGVAMGVAIAYLLRRWWFKGNTGVTK